MPARARLNRAPMPLSVTPSKAIVPEDTPCWPVTARSSDDLPTPLRPSTQVILPISALIDTPRRAWAAP